MHKRDAFLDLFVLASTGIAFSVTLFITPSWGAFQPFYYIFLVAPIFVGATYFARVISNPAPKALKRDLQHVGFDGPGLQKDLIESLLIAGSDGVSAIPVKPKIPNRLKAYLAYGIKTSRYLPENFGEFSSKDYHVTTIGFYDTEAEKKLRTLTFRSIQESVKILKKEKKKSLKPIPLAAYLFRVASLNLDPENEDVQERALLLWNIQRDLDLVFKTRSATLQELKDYSGLPDSWLKEVIALPDEEVR